MSERKKPFHSKTSRSEAVQLHIYWLKCCKICYTFLHATLAAKPHTSKRLSAINNSVSSRKAAAGNVDAAVVAHVAHSSRSRTDAVFLSERLKSHQHIRNKNNLWHHGAENSQL